MFSLQSFVYFVFFSFFFASLLAGSGRLCKENLLFLNKFVSIPPQQQQNFRLFSSPFDFEPHFFLRNNIEFSSRLTNFLIFSFFSSCWQVVLYCVTGSESHKKFFRLFFFSLLLLCYLISKLLFFYGFLSQEAEFFFNF